MEPQRELTDLLADIRLFSKCSARQRRAIARHAQIAIVPEGVDVITEGEAGDALFVILEGEAVVYQGDLEVSRSGVGGYFGEMAILDGEPRSATVVAATEVKVAVIGMSVFRTMLRDYSDLAEQLLIALAGELRAARTAQEPG